MTPTPPVTTTPCPLCGAPDCTGQQDCLQRVAAQRDEARQQLAETQQKNKKLRHEITVAQSNNRARNIELDALHYVWCDGGCLGGAHRFHDEELTGDIVAAAVSNTQRLITWYLNHEYRRAHKGEITYSQFQEFRRGVAHLQSVAEITAERDAATLQNARDACEIAELKRSVHCLEVGLDFGAKFNANLTEQWIEEIETLTAECDELKAQLKLSSSEREKLLCVELRELARQLEEVRAAPLPTVQVGELHIEDKPNNMKRVFGKWPGDETDEEIEQALKEMS